MRRASSSLLPPSFIAASANDSFSADAAGTGTRELDGAFVAGATDAVPALAAVPPLAVESAPDFASSFGLGGGAAGGALAGIPPPAFESFVVSIDASLNRNENATPSRHAAARPSLRPAKPSAHRRA